MSMNRIPQDELTLDLLAAVLVKMYRYSLSKKGDAPDEVTEPASGAYSAVPENQRHGHISTEREFVQAGTDR